MRLVRRGFVSYEAATAAWRRRQATVRPSMPLGPVPPIQVLGFKRRWHCAPPPHYRPLVGAPSPGAPSLVCPRSPPATLPICLALALASPSLSLAAVIVGASSPSSFSASSPPAVGAPAPRSSVLASPSPAAPLPAPSTSSRNAVAWLAAAVPPPTLPPVPAAAPLLALALAASASPSPSRRCCTAIRFSIHKRSNSARCASS